MKLKVQCSAFEERTVDAHRVNRYFAVHPETRGRGSWTVTHIPSGYASPVDLPTKERAIRCAQLLDALTTEWDFTKPVEEWSKTRFKGFRWLCTCVAEGKSVGVCGRYRVDA